MSIYKGTPRYQPEILVKPWPEGADVIDMEFDFATKVLNECLEQIPDEYWFLRPEIDLTDRSRVFIANDKQYEQFAVLAGEKKASIKQELAGGDPAVYKKEIDQQRQRAAIKPAINYGQGVIVLRKLFNFDPDMLKDQFGIDTYEKTFSFLANAVSISLLPVEQDITLEEATLVFETFPEELKSYLNGMGYNEEDFYFENVGGSIHIIDKSGVTLEIVGVGGVETVQRIFEEGYMVYMMFLRFCLENDIDNKVLRTNGSAYKKALEAFRKSESALTLAVPEEIVGFEILEKVEMFGTFEDLLNSLYQAMNTTQNNNTTRLPAMEKAALEELAEAVVIRDIISEYLTNSTNYNFFLQYLHSNLQADIEAIRLEYQVFGNEVANNYVNLLKKVKKSDPKAIREYLAFLKGHRDLSIFVKDMTAQQLSFIVKVIMQEERGARYIDSALIALELAIQKENVTRILKGNSGVLEGSQSVVNRREDIKNPRLAAIAEAVKKNGNQSIEQTRTKIRMKLMKLRKVVTE